MNFNNLTEQRYLMKPGYLIIYDKPLYIYGVVGSGVFIALWDKRKKYSGCCLFLYPKVCEKQQSTAQYGNVALNHLIFKMQQEGSRVSDLKALIIGGGTVKNKTFDNQNHDIACKVLKRKSIEVISKDAGGTFGRKFIYETTTAEHMVMKVHKIRATDWYPYIAKAR